MAFGYIESFDAHDRERVFHFLVLFSRWEFALKHEGLAKSGIHGQAEADWKEFAKRHSAAIAAITNQEFTSARDRLLANPPEREEMIGPVAHQQVEWRKNPRRQGERDDTEFLLRIVKDVRNNLFHGGKFAASHRADLARDRSLIDDAIAVLQGIGQLEHRIDVRLNERV